VSEPRYTVDQFSEDPEVWNIRDSFNKIVAQADSEDDAKGTAMVYEAHFDLGVKSCNATIARLTAELEGVKRERDLYWAECEAWRARCLGDTFRTDDPICLVVKQTDALRAALSERPQP
jgi:hypothetical protein